jgi:solute carrier family 35 protein F1/2
MLLSRLVLRAAYRARHLAGVAAVLCGFVVLVATDAACRRRDGAAAPAPFLGDMLAVLAACLYATSNVLQERLLREAPVGEVLAAFGTLGALISGVQAGVLEARALGAASWDASFCGALAFFAAAMFAIYSLVPRVLPAAGSAAFNLHMLSSDLWAAAARSVLFGGFGGACAAGGFGGSLCAVAAGLCLYFSAGPPAAAEAEAAPEDEHALLAEEATQLHAENSARTGVDVS